MHVIFSLHRSNVHMTFAIALWKFDAVRAVVKGGRVRMSRHDEMFHMKFERRRVDFAVFNVANSDQTSGHSAICHQKLRHDSTPAGAENENQL
eukprot:4865672-Amphidinium_carterae.1